MTASIGHFIGGRQTDETRAARHGDVYNPATGAVTSRVALADRASHFLVVARNPSFRNFEPG